MYFITTGLRQGFPRLPFTLHRILVLRSKRRLTKIEEKFPLEQLCLNKFAISPGDNTWCGAKTIFL